MQCIWQTPGPSLGFGDHYHLQNGIGPNETAMCFDVIDIASVMFEFSVRDEYFDELGVSPEDVAFHRRFNDWTPLPTEYVGTTVPELRFEAVLPGLSSFATGTSEPLTTMSEVTLEESELVVGETAIVTATIANRDEVAVEHGVELRAKRRHGRD